MQNTYNTSHKSFISKWDFKKHFNATSLPTIKLSSTCKYKSIHIIPIISTMIKVINYKTIFNNSINDGNKYIFSKIMLLKQNFYVKFHKNKHDFSSTLIIEELAFSSDRSGTPISIMQSTLSWKRLWQIHYFYIGKLVPFNFSIFFNSWITTFLTKIITIKKTIIRQLTNNGGPWYNYVYLTLYWLTLMLICLEKKVKLWPQWWFEREEKRMYQVIFYEASKKLQEPQ